MLFFDEPYTVQCRVCLHRKPSFHAILPYSVLLACFWQARLAGGLKTKGFDFLFDGMIIFRQSVNDDSFIGPRVDGRAIFPYIFSEIREVSSWA